MKYGRDIGDFVGLRRGQDAPEDDELLSCLTLQPSTSLQTTAIVDYWRQVGLKEALKTPAASQTKTDSEVTKYLKEVEEVHIVTCKT